MIIVEILFVASLGLLLGLGVLNSVKNNQRQQQLDNSFYNLLESENGQISLIQLAANARIDAEIARQYLERQAKIFAATVEVDAEGDTYYRFPKLRRPSDT